MVGCMERIKLKKRKNKIRFKRNLVLTSTLVLLFVLGIGYSSLSTNLDIVGNITVKKSYGKTLYEVIEKDANIGAYASEYTREHGDSMDSSKSTEKIYSYRATNNTMANEIIDKFNVIFGNFCWQMYRTTDTGGVMLQYNGEVENGRCLSTRGSHIGYSNYTTRTLNTSYYYGSNYTYNSTDGLFYLSGTKATGSIPLGTYTCASSNSTAGCSTLYLVDILSSGSSYYVFYINNNINYAIIGKTPYNYRSNSPADVGYMYNARYTVGTRAMAPSTSLFTRSSTDASYYYGDLQIVSGQYKLTNVFQMSSTSEASNTMGKYTLRSTNPNETASTAYYIAYAYSTYTYSLTLTSGNDLSYYDTVYTYGSSYTDNGNGTYTINDPNTLQLSRWAIDGNSSLERKYVCINATNNSCSELLRIHHYDVSSYTSFSTNRIYKIGSNFTYNNGNYTISNDESTSSVWNLESVDYFYNKYTCFNSSGICPTLYRAFVSGGNTDIYDYVSMTDGKGIEDINDEMFSNVYNSTAKSALDYWYEKEIYGSSFEAKIDDIIFCSPRRNETNSYTFRASGFKCDSITDRFSISNNQAKLKYPVGLITYNEKEYFNNSIIRRVDEDYYTISPYNYFASYGAQLNGVTSAGGTFTSGATGLRGLRPVIALKSGTEYVSGTGSRDDPYVVSTLS